MSSNKKTQIIAAIALLCIIISIIWTWLLFILWNNNTSEQTELTPEQITEIQKMIEEQSKVDNYIIDDNIEIQDFTNDEELESNN